MCEFTKPWYDKLTTTIALPSYSILTMPAMYQFTKPQYILVTCTDHKLTPHPKLPTN